MLGKIRILPAILFALLSPAARAENPPTTLWVQSWNGPNNHEDIGRFVAVDTPDRIYVAGSTYEPGAGGAGHDYLLLQYDSDGNLNWFRRYGGQGEETLSDLAVPVSGEVIVTGFSPGLNSLEVATVKYDQLGDILWERRHPARGASSDYGPKLAVDGEKNVIVSAADAGDYLALKYAPDGTLLWSRTYDGPASQDDFATDVAVDAGGNVYLTGAANSLHAFATVKLSPAGDFLWEQIEPGDIGSVFAPSKLAVGPDNNVVVAGSPESTCGVFQFKIWKCASASGAVLWSDKQPSQPCSSFIFRDLTLDESGAALAACSGSAGGVEGHMQVLRYSTDGVREWIREYDGPGTAEDTAEAIAADAVGAAYVVGSTDFPPQNRDYAAAKFSAAGEQEWSFTWASPHGTNDLAHDICVDPAGGVILTGNSFDQVQNENVVSIKLLQATAAGVAESSPGAAPPVQLRMEPNPAFGEATISYVLPRAGRIRLDLLSADGRLLRTLAEGPCSTGLHTIHWSASGAEGLGLPGGVYFLRLEAGGRVTTTKAGLLR